MKVGDLILRKAMRWDRWSAQQNKDNGIGVVIAKDESPERNRTVILTVYYSKTKRVSTIAETLVELINESR